MFSIEALVIIVKPLLIALPITVVSVIFFLNIAYLDPVTFLNELSVIPITVFFLTVIGSVCLAYFIGARNVLNSSLIESLRDDSII